MKPGVCHARYILRVCPTRRITIVHHPPWRPGPSHSPSASLVCSHIGRDRHSVSSERVLRRPSTGNSTSRTDKADQPPKQDTQRKTHNSLLFGKPFALLFCFITVEKPYIISEQTNRISEQKSIIAEQTTGIRNVLPPCQGVL